MARDALRAGMRRHVTRHAGGALLWTMALLGALCIVLAVLAVVLDARIALFRTGSMSPTITPGSAALTVPVAASDVVLGDVVTVERPGLLPVTHRVVDIGEAPGESRVLTLKGDANAVADPEPYVVTSVRRVLWDVPGVAPTIALTQNPLVLGAFTLGASALVVWAFWPRRGQQREERAGASPAVMAAFVVAGAVGLVVLPGARDGAVAAPQEHVVRGQFLTLTSIGDAARMRAMSPGDVVTWQVGIEADTPEPGTIDVSLSGDGDPTQLRLTVRSCSLRSTASDCPNGEILLDDVPLPIDDTVRPLLTLDSDQSRWLSLDVHLPEDATPAASSVDLTVHAAGAGDDVSTGSQPGSSPAVVGEGALATTGSQARAFVLLASALLVVGVLLVAGRGTRLDAHGRQRRAGRL